MANDLFVGISLLRSEAAIRDQSTDPLYLKDRVLAHPGSCKWCTGFSRYRCTAACHGAGGVGWVAALVLGAKIDYN